MKGNILISILVPVYGVEQYIERCARSLLEQTYSDIEYVFVNDCSPDKSMDILYRVLDDYPERKSKIKIVNHIQNEGLAVARNTAVQNTTGEYVMHVDSDDYLEVTAVERVVQKIIEENPDVVIFDMNYVHSGHNVKVSSHFYSNKSEYLHKLIRRNSSVCLCGGVYRLKLYKDNDIRAIPGVNYGEDYVTKPRLIYFANKVSYLSEALYNYNRDNENSYTRNMSVKSINSIKRICEYLDAFFTVNNNEIDSDLFITEMKICNKLFLLKKCDSDRYTYINSLFPEVNKCTISLDLKNRILLCLSRRGYLKLMCLYLFIWRQLQSKFSLLK